jgi:uncharacterized protein (DUF1800 family)
MRSPRPRTAFATLALLLPSLLPVPAGAAASWPHRSLGWSEREAAAHLLDRFTFGPRPGDLDRAVALGVEAWFEEQLAARREEAALSERLARYPSQSLGARQILEQYPPPQEILRRARSEGVKLERLEPNDESEVGEKDRRALLRFVRESGLGTQRELAAEVLGQKLDRALLAENQLAEVMTDFWFNHFYVSATDRQAAPLVLPYERDAIRPNALGSFRTLLDATARHPAMLLYLDNARSIAEPGAPTSTPTRRGRERSRRAPSNERAPQGLNENYARELLELHTLGVDGGYDQNDVVAVARAFTGWTVMPPAERRQLDSRTLARARAMGFVQEGDFLFRANVHDAGPKTVLGHRLPAGRGIEDGEAVLDLLARHPSTARHLARKIAVRFVSDDPPPSLVERLARAFESSGGDTRTVLRALVTAPEFWAKEVRGAKIKAPFEVATSALRTLDARVYDGRGVLEWVATMGQPLYRYGAPTGFPDRAEQWVSSGALLARMNFGLALAGGRIVGVVVDPRRLEPSPERVGQQLGAPEFQRR